MEWEFYSPEQGIRIRDYLLEKGEMIGNHHDKDGNKAEAFHYNSATVILKQKNEEVIALNVDSASANYSIRTYYELNRIAVDKWR